MNRMRDLAIWKFVGGVSAINGLVCFALSSTYNMSFGKLGFGGLIAYLLVGLIICLLLLRAKRILVSEKVQGLVIALIFVVICFISILREKLLYGKSDPLSIILYGSFALMSVSMSRKSELDFETGFSSFFLQLFAAQLFKIKWILLPFALLVCSLVIVLRHYYSESGVQFDSIASNGYHNLIEVGPPNEATIEFGDEDINEESSQAMHHWPSDGEVSEGSISDWDNRQQNNQEEDTLSLPFESWDQDHVSSRNNRGREAIQNHWMHSSTESELMSSALPPRELLRRRRRMTAAVHNILSSVGDALGRRHSQDWLNSNAILSLFSMIFFLFLLLSLYYVHRIETKDISNGSKYVWTPQEAHMLVECLIQVKIDEKLATNTGLCFEYLKRLEDMLEMRLSNGVLKDNSHTMS